jgi:TRAP-type C4-dicarboxylate transport system substrate-binding protein
MHRHTLARLLAAATLGLVANSALAQEYSWRFQNSEPSGSPIFGYIDEWTDLVKERSGGRIEIELMPVGSVVEYNETLDAVAAGILDGHVTDMSYWAGRNPAFGLLANPVGAWAAPEQMVDFIENGGGKELATELLGSYGLHFIGVTTPGLESFVSRVPITKVDDLKGIKIRAPEGLVGNVFAAAGASPVNLPASEVYTSLDKGVVDAADYSAFSVNQAQGLNDIAPNPVYPGFHSMPLIEVSINKDTWDSLPDDLKQVMEETVKELQLNWIAATAADNEKALETAQANPAITIHNWSDEERAKFRAIAQGEWQKVATQSPEAQEVFDTLTTYLREKGLMQ